MHRDWVATIVALVSFGISLAALSIALILIFSVHHPF